MHEQLELVGLTQIAPVTQVRPRGLAARREVRIGMIDQHEEARVQVLGAHRQEHEPQAWAQLLRALGHVEPDHAQALEVGLEPRPVGGLDALGPQARRPAKVLGLQHQPVRHGQLLAQPRAAAELRGPEGDRPPRLEPQRLHDLGLNERLVQLVPPRRPGHAPPNKH